MASPELSFLARLIRAHLRSNLRGQTRLTNLLADKISSLSAIPITFADRAPVYMDLRTPATQEWLKGSPWESSPQEIEEQNVMRRFVHRGDTVFDIGAHLGLHTALLSRLVGERGQIYAFEPNRQLRRLLTRTTEALKNAEVLPYALSAATGDAELFVPLAHDSTGSLREWQKDWAGEMFAMVCEQRRLDELSLPQPQFVKCDVEGAELEVFRGAEKMLDRSDAPVLLFEANEWAAQAFGATAAAAGDFLMSLPKAHYRLYFLQPDGRLTKEKEHDQSYWSMVALPEDRVRQ
jgi:FkbM family methyltransferase